MKKIKQFIIIVSLSIFILLFVGVKTARKAEALSETVMDVEMKAYDEQGIKDLLWKFDIQTYLNTIIDNGLGGEIDGCSNNRAFIVRGYLTKEDIQYFESNYNIWDISDFAKPIGGADGQSMHDYWGASFDSFITSNITWETQTSGLSASVKKITGFGRALTDTQKTTVVPGESFYVAAIASSASTGIKNIVASLNFREWMTNGGTVEGQTSYFEISSAVLHSNQTPINYHLTTGFTYTAGTTADERFIGAYKLTAGSSQSGSYEFINTSTNYSTWSNTAGVNAQGSQAAYWNNTGTTVTVGGTLSSTTDMQAPTISTSSLSSATLTTSDGTNYTLPSGTNISASDTALNIGFTPTDNATITNVKYSTTSTTAAQTGTSASGAGNSYSVPINGISSGASMYVAVEVTSQDGTATKWYYITVSKPASTEKSLDSFTITSNSPAGTTANRGDTTVASTMNIKIAYDATSIIFNLNYTGYRAVFDSTEYTSGTISVTKSFKTSFTLVVYDQAGGSITYTFNISRLSGVGTPTVTINPYQGTTADTSKVINSFSETATTGTASSSGYAYATTTFNVSATAPTSGRVVSVNGVSGTSASNISFASSPVTLVVVTEDESGITHTYTITLTKNDPDSSTEVETVIINGTPAGTSSTPGVDFTTGTPLPNNTTSTDISFTPGNNATVDGVYVYTTPEAAQGDVNNPGANSDPNHRVTGTTAPYTITNLQPGETVYVGVFVTAEDGTKGVQVIEVTVSPSSDCSVTSISANYNGTALSVNSSGNSYTVLYPQSATSINLIVAYTGAKVFIGSQSYSTASPVTVSVAPTSNLTVYAQAADGTTNSTSYTVTFQSLRTASEPGVTVRFNDGSIDNSVTASSWSATNTATVNVLYGVTSFQVCASSVPGGASLVSINGQSITELLTYSTSISFGSGIAAISRTLDIVVRNEAGTTETYTLTVTKGAASSDATPADPNNVATGPTSQGGNATYTDIIVYVLNSRPETETSYAITGIAAATHGGTPGTSGKSYTSLANAISGTSSTQTVNISSGSATVTLGDTGTSVFFAVEYTAEDGTSKALVIYEVPRSSSANANLEGITFSATGDSSSSSVTLCDTSNNSTTFSSSTTEYNIVVPMGATGIDVTALFSSGKTANITDTLGTSALTSSVVKSVSANSSTIRVTVTAQDGSSSKTYTFNVVKLSADASITDVTVQGLDANNNVIDTYPATYNSTTNNWEVTVPYLVKNVKIMVTTTDSNVNTVRIINQACGNATWSSAIAITNAAIATNATSLNAAIQVVAQNGNTSNTTNALISRSAADTTNTIQNDFVVQVQDELGNWNDIAGADDGSGSNWTATNSVAYTSTAVRVLFTLNSNLATVTAGGSAVTVTSGQLTGNSVAFTGTTQATVNYQIVVTPQAGSSQAKTYTFQVVREAAERNFNYDIEINYTDSNGAHTITTLPTQADALPFSVKTLTWKLSKESSKSSIQLVSVIAGGTTVQTGSTGVDISGVSNALSLSSTTAGSNGYIQYVIAAKIFGEDGTSSENINVIIYVENPGTANTLGTADLLVDGVIVAPGSTSGVTKNYSLDETQIFTLDLVVQNDPNNLTKIYYTVDVPLSNAATDYSSQAYLYVNTRQFTPGQTVYVYVIPEDMNIAQYIFRTTSTAPQQTNAEIESIIIDETSLADNGDLGSFGYVENAANGNLGTFNVPYGLKTLTFTVTPKQNSSLATADTAQTIKALSTTYTVNLTNTGTTANVITVRLKAQNGSYGTLYTITVYRAEAQTYDLIDSITIDSNVVDKNTTTGEYDNTIDVVINRTNTSVRINSLSVTPTDGTLSNAKYEIKKGNTTIASGTNQSASYINLTGFLPNTVTTYKISVWSEQATIDGLAPNEYTLNIYTADQSYSITDINLVNALGNNIFDTTGSSFGLVSGQNTYTFTVAYGVSLVKCLVKPQTPNYTTVYINGVKQLDQTITDLQEGTGLTSNKFTVVVDSEFKTLLNATNPSSTLADNQTVSYEIQVDRNAGSNVSTLSSLVVRNNSTDLTLDQEFVADSTTDIAYTITNPTITSPSVTIIVKPTDSNAYLNAADWTKNSDGTWTRTFTIPNCYAGAGVDICTIDVFPESGAKTPYTVTLSQSQISLDTDHTITSITASTTNTTTGTTTIHVGAAGSGATDTFVQDNPRTFGPYQVEATVNQVSFTITWPAKATLYVNGTVLPSTSTSTGVATYTLPMGTDSASVTIMCMAEAGGTNTESYTFNFTKATADTSTNLDSFYIEDTTTGSIVYDLLNAVNSNETTIYLDNSYAGKELNVVASVSGSKQLSGVTGQRVFNVGANPISVTVTAEDGVTTKQYTVMVVVNASLELGSIQISTDQGTTALTQYNATTSTYDEIVDPVAYINAHYDGNITTLNVPNLVSQIRFMATTKDSLARFSVTSQVNSTLSSWTTIGNGSTTVAAYTLLIVIEDQEGNSRSYTIDIMRTPGETGKDILTYRQEGQTEDATDFQSSGFAYEYRVNTSIHTFNPDLNWTLSDGATAIIKDSNGGSSRVLSVGKNVFTVEVYSENEPTVNPHVYTITVWKANNDFNISNIEWLTASNGSALDESYIYDQENNSYNITVPYNVTTAYLSVLLSDTVNAKWQLNGVDSINDTKALAIGVNVFSIVGVSQYGILNPDASRSSTTVTYTYTITREAPSSDATLKDLQVAAFDTTTGKWINLITNTYYEDGTRPGDLPDELVLVNSQYIIGSIDSLVADEHISKVYIYATTNDVNASIISGTGEKPLTVIGTESATASWLFTVSVQAEDGVTKLDYDITLSRAVANPSKDNTVANISVIAGGKEYIATFNPAEQKYEISIPYGPDSYTVSATTAAGSTAKLYIGTTSNPTTEGNITKTLGLVDCLTDVTYYIQAEATDSTVGRGMEYEVKINFLDADHDNTLKELKVDGTLITGFDPDTLTYTIEVPFTTSSLDFTAIANSSKATVVAGIGSVSLLPGATTQQVITVRAEDGTTQNYIVNVKRDSEDPYFTNLEVPGYQLLDKETEQPVEFDQTAPGFDADGQAIVEEYRVTVPYSQAKGSITVNVSDSNYTTTISQTGETILSGLTRTFTNLTFNVGADDSSAETEFIITGTSPAGKTCIYKVIVTRLGAQSADTSINLSKVDAFDGLQGNGTKVTGVETDAFKDDFKFGVVNYSYKVPNIVKSLDFAISAAQSDAKVNVYGAEKLEAGQTNNVVIVVTAADGITTKAYVVSVYREEMVFELDSEANTGYELQNINEEGNVYTAEINLGTNKFADLVRDKKINLADYLKYDSSTNAIEYEILSDLENEDLNEVLIKVTDGTDEKFVRLSLNQDASFMESLTNSAGGFFLIGGILICVILLTAILIAVNKEKYGKVSEKRKLKDRK